MIPVRVKFSRHAGWLTHTYTERERGKKREPDRERARGREMRALPSVWVHIWLRELMSDKDSQIERPNP